MFLITLGHSLCGLNLSPSPVPYSGNLQLGVKPRNALVFRFSRLPCYILIVPHLGANAETVASTFINLNLPLRSQPLRLQDGFDLVCLLDGNLIVLVTYGDGDRNMNP